MLNEYMKSILGVARFLYPGTSSETKQNIQSNLSFHGHVPNLALELLGVWVCHVLSVRSLEPSQDPMMLIVTADLVLL
ncbi:hypothetical protein RRG08_000672 [Elysia crispata]|uniref:Uncharacterized protein n=1 Tax=Elysia crispata TaxID=231223 RepID=A0AAE0YI08_9GAST|nr:hypothetical protein RRG08_000672 [Elysia crispata]